MSVSFDTSILSSYYQARDGSAASGATAVPGKKYAPTPPWSITVKNAAAVLSKDVKDALAGRKLVDPNAAQLDLPGASEDYRKLFSLYRSLGTLNGVAEHIKGKSLTAADKTRIEAAFARGLAEVRTYADGLELKKLRLTTGAVADSARTTVGVAKDQTSYTTPPLVSANIANPVAAFAGDVRFNMVIKRIGVTYTVPIDLAVKSVMVLMAAWMLCLD